METLRKGLKAGDKFMDGKRYFVVDEVLAGGRYISHEISEEEAEEVEGSCLNCKNKDELKEMAEELGLPVSGTKADLIGRIEEKLAEMDAAGEDQNDNDGLDGGEHNHNE